MEFTSSINKIKKNNNKKVYSKNKHTNRSTQNKIWKKINKIVLTSSNKQKQNKANKLKQSLTIKNKQKIWIKKNKAEQITTTIQYKNNEIK